MKVTICSKCGKVRRKSNKKEGKNPYPKYSYKSGIAYSDGSPAFGMDIRWMFYEIDHGRIPKYDFKIGELT